MAPSSTGIPEEAVADPQTRVGPGPRPLRPQELCTPPIGLDGPAHTAPPPRGGSLRGLSRGPG